MAWYDEYGPTTDSGTYFTHFNGGVPYKVVIDEQGSENYTYNSKDEDEDVYQEAVYEL